MSAAALGCATRTSFATWGIYQKPTFGVGNRNIVLQATTAQQAFARRHAAL
ncbi:hypothetical protein FRACA_1290016 [Frankia canadensis]|uniref:Uncharacterized protein n=1 Tax=Frankia canadensis TaxID=1836972 RepID=A0A2I2KKH7_9ACTN|nr:hypothetical protein FRACA_1290016 [Frankia canadensis]SOU53453.1 hypothetical protein FRACA_1290016 [Frankia canadensis]